MRDYFSARGWRVDLPDIDLGPNEYRGSSRAKEGCLAPGAWITIIALAIIGGIMWALAQGVLLVRSTWGFWAFAAVAVIGVLASLLFAAHLDRQRARQANQDEHE